MDMFNDTQNVPAPLIHHEDFPEIIIITCILSVFSIVGTTGNAFVLYVFSRKKDKNTSTVFILALATTDFLTCLFVIPFTIFVNFVHKQVQYDWVCKLYQFLITSNVPFSAFIMVAIAFDRYFCICRPWMKLLDIKCARRIIMSLLVLAIALGLFTCLAYGVYKYQIIEIPIGNSSVGGTGFYQSANHSLLDGHVAITFIEDTTEGRYESNVTLVNYQLNSLIGGNDRSATTNTSTMLVFTGSCDPNEVILSTAIRKQYQKFYASLFLISFITVFFLYALIYKSLLSRRSKRLRTSVAHRYGRRSTLLTSVLTRNSHYDRSTNTPDGNNQAEKPNNMKTMTTPNGTYLLVPKKHDKDVTETNLDEPVTEVKTEGDESDRKQTVTIVQNDCKTGSGKQGKCASKSYARKVAKKNNNTRFRETLNEKSKCLNENGAEQPKPNGTRDGTDQSKVALPPVNMHRQDTRKSGREKHRIANIKTAGILFIVTLVFILAFLPAWLMAIQLIPPNMIVFYMYFSYNVANPVIYAFFNHTFQKEVKCMLKCDNWWVTV